MNSNNNENSTVPPKKTGWKNYKRGAGRFNQYNRNGAVSSGPRERPVSIPIPSLPFQSQNEPSSSSTNQFLSERAFQLNTRTEPLSIRVDNFTCEYPGWKLYFPKEGTNWMVED